MYLGLAISNGAINTGVVNYRYMMIIDIDFYAVLSPSKIPVPARRALPAMHAEWAQEEYVDAFTMRGICIIFNARKRIYIMRKRAFSTYSILYRVAPARALFTMRER